MEPQEKPKKNNGKSRYPLALPSALYEWYQKEAERQYRSVNSLMAFALQEYKDRRDGPPFGD